jgi:hypothetical protein
MMVEAITLLKQQLNEHVARSDGTGPGSSDQVVLGNLAQLDRQEIATELDNRIVLSLVNLEEEKTLKNARAVASSAAGDVVYRNPPVHLNLYLLFASNYRNYETALKRTALVLGFFQGKQRFTFANSPGSQPPQALPVEFSLVMDLMSLTFEQVNHLWGFLGAKQLPFALYRARLVTISDPRVLAGGGRVLDIEVNSRDMTA